MMVYSQLARWRGRGKVNHEDFCVTGSDYCVLVSMQGLRRNGGTAPLSYQSPLGCCRLWAVHAPQHETQRATDV